MCLVAVGVVVFASASEERKAGGCYRLPATSCAALLPALTTSTDPKQQPQRSCGIFIQ